ncbi:MAG TPA: hypothetical protein VMR81_02250 [Patescibacteria group bacterium]|nr:hypothetical protein [Patescibacteria group bacterium]
MDNTDQKLINIYTEAYKFLSGKVSPEVLNTELDHYSQYQPASLNDIFRGMVISLKNKQGYKNFIANVDEMKEILRDFNPNEVVQTYGHDWELLLDVFKDKFGANHKIDPTNNRNAWVIYSRGVLSCAKFIVNFNSVNDFDQFVKSFFYNEYTVAALPMLLDKEIFGFGFPLACDFLKEQGYTKYGKPDVHLIDIFTELAMVSERSEYEVFKTIVKIGKLVHKEPVVVDKIFWLIGSGYFNVSDVNIGRQKEKFIEYMKSNGFV